MKSHLTIGTRGSKLALWQAHYTRDRLEALGVEVTLKVIKTRGDNIQHLGFSKMEGKGFFTKELEDALLRGEIDLAVHSMKDMPTTAPEGLCITAVSYRDKVADTLVVKASSAATDRPLKLPAGAIVGTSSARRKAQLLDLCPDVETRDIRGNVPTRLQKLREQEFDAIMLASAGLNRLQIDLSEFVVVELNPREFVPAPAQGVLAWQTCTHDVETRRVLQRLHVSEVVRCTNVERGVLNRLEGGCQMPLGVYCEQDANMNYHVWAAQAAAWDAPVKRVRVSSSTTYGLVDQVIAQLKG